VLAASEDDDALFDAIKAGAAAFILKDVGPGELVTIIRRVTAGEYLINDKVFARQGRSRGSMAAAARLAPPTRGSP
jgi:DNA-binding NarL/FixJ family response regulator